MSLTDDLAHAFARHPSLTRLNLFFYTTPDPSVALTALVSSSKTISSLTIQPSGYSDALVPLQCMQRNVHLLETNLFDWCFGVASRSERQQLKYKHASRNRRLLHNWQCICVLLASYRANAKSRFRDSMLSLMVDVMSFLVPDEWYVERRR